MPHMPKHMTKGPYFVALGTNHSPSVSSTAPDQRPVLLTNLRNPAVNIAEIMTISQVDGAAGVTHVKTHWFGAGSAPNGPTGWWRNWKGEPEKVLRCGLIRALEVAMGLNHSCPHHTSGPVPGSDPLSRPATNRDLPIEYSWVCGVSRFEVFVSWNEQQVSVIIVTPGFPFSLIEYDDEYAAGTGSALDAWSHNDLGTIYIGQDEDLPNSGDSPQVKQLKKKNTVMKPGVVTHRLDESRGGSGQP